MASLRDAEDAARLAVCGFVASGRGGKSPEYCARRSEHLEFPLRR